MNATKTDGAKNVDLQDLLKNLLTDTHLSGQMELRCENSLSQPFVVKNKNGAIDEETTILLSESVAFGELLEVIFETPFFGHSLFEILPSESDLFTLSLLPRRNVVPSRGLLLLDTSADKGIPYRAEPGYGTSIIEVGKTDDLGILFDCGPATIYRRYALAAWSEFAELYGIPPRTLKIDTSDDESFARAREMMQNTGSGNWSIIDINEEMLFGQGMSDNGNIFAGLIAATKEDISLKICGVQMGQDTKHGNRSKEETSITLFDKKCLADRRNAKKFINKTLFPALAALNIIPNDLSFDYPNDSEDDTEELWDRTLALMPYYDMDEKWLKEKFGVQISGRKQGLGTNSGGEQLSIRKKGEDPDFFG